MANVPYTHGMGAPGYAAASTQASSGAQNSLKNMTNLAAAGLSVALIIGVGVWGYKLMVRDVTGLPVVQAAKGDMRVPPENPGGQLAQNQGLSVNEVAGIGSAGAPPDTLVLAPKPVALTTEDTPALTDLVAAVQQPKPLVFDTPASDQPVANNETSHDSSVDDLLRQLTGAGEASDTINNISGAKVVAAVQTVSVDTAAQELAAQTPVVQGPGLRLSLRPSLRPASAPAVVIPVAVPARATTNDVNPASVPAGTRLVQLGAFDSEEIARSQWDKIQNRFGDFLEGKSRIVQKAESGGRTFYRLRAMGFEDLSDARRFCSALLAESADCIPVVTR
jgi:hypothetical protein